MKLALCLSLKGQKKYLLEHIDEAMKGASEETIPDFNKGDSPGRSEDIIKWQRENVKKLAERKKRIGTITIEVPSGGVFEILNTKQSLSAFKKMVTEFSASIIPGIRPSPKVVTKPTEKRITGKGVKYYNEFKPRKEGLIEGKKEEMEGKEQNRNYYNQGWFTNGCYAIKIEKPAGMTFLEAKPDIKAVIPTEGLEPAKIIGEFFKGEYNDAIPYAHVVTESGTDIVLNARYIDSVLTKYPKAKIFGSDYKLVFKVDNKPVAVVMGMLGTSEFLAPFADRIAEVKGESSVEDKEGLGLREEEAGIKIIGGEKDEART